MSKQRPPVITGLDPHQFDQLLDFMERVRSGNVNVAKAEAQRLMPYFQAFSDIVQDDVYDLVASVRKERLYRLVRPQNLQHVFNAVAKSSRNTILSEVLIAPQKILNKVNLPPNASQFGDRMKYDGSTFTLAFIQLFDSKETSSVSVPVLALDTLLMQQIENYYPTEMLRALQTVMTAGNHDVLHHFLNRALNPDIAAASADEGAEVLDKIVRAWVVGNFSGAGDLKDDKDIRGNESWAMLAHAAVRKEMYIEGEDQKLKSACSTFFNELERIGKLVRKTSGEEEAHKLVDYFGTVFCYTMMRYMPLSEPLVQHAIQRLRQADPTPEAVASKKTSLLWSMFKRNDIFPTNYASDTINNYTANRTPLLAGKDDYVAAKELQLIAISPWVAHLMSPAQPGTLLAEVQNRVGTLNLGMVEAVAASVLFSPTDGAQRFRLFEGDSVEIHHRNGKLCEKKPAIVETAIDGTRTEQWFSKGKLSRIVRATQYGCRSEERFLEKKAAPQKKNKGPA